MKEAIVAFELTMPNNNSWNGQWSGDKDLHVKFRKLGRGKAAHDKAKEIASISPQYYNFGDGWGALVKVYIVDTKKKNELAKRSAGFCGYDWMIDSILHFGDIRTEKITKS